MESLALWSLEVVSASLHCLQVALERMEEEREGDVELVQTM